MSAERNSTHMSGQAMRHALFAEWIGTFILVFAGTGAIVVNDVGGGSITHLGIALTFGLVVMSMIYTIGDVSGAHMNPAVTLALATIGKFPWSRVVPYLAAQIIGGLLASLLLRSLFAHPTLGATVPSGSAMQSWILEAVLTAILLISVCSFARGPKERGPFAGLAIGGVIGLEALFAGPICGASMNPARSIGPAVVSGDLDFLWLYITAPVFGAWIGVRMSVLLFPDLSSKSANP